MTWLDCTNLDTTLTSVAAILGTNMAKLREAILAYEASRFEDRSEDPSEDPYARMPSEVVTALGSDVEAVEFDGAHYFHGTRVFEPDAILRSGLLPLNQMVEPIWAVLFELVQDVCDPVDWQVFRADLEAGGGGHDGWLYRTKTRDTASSFGPFAVLVRHVLFKSDAVGNHDYLGCPEIVQDIARVFRSSFGVDLEERFREASKPVIVTFRSSSAWTGSLRAALWYVFDMLRDAEVTSNANECFDGGGCPVAPDEIVSVEVVDRP